MAVLRLLVIPTLLCGRASASVIAPGSAENEYAMTSNGDESTTCDGFEKEEAPCPAQDACARCNPANVKNCVFNDWSPWSNVGQYQCDELCTRKRTVKTANNNCGTPCSGVSEEKKRCELSADNHNCGGNKRDCKFGDWLEWNTCTTDYDQQKRKRSMIPAASGGQPCIGVKSETRGCGFKSQPVDCELSQWHDWTECSSTCGQGQMTRSRRFKHEAQNGGLACTGNMQHIGPCQMADCPGASDCKVSDWSPWLGCDGQTTQQFRKRAILTPNTEGGKGCPANIEETLPCPDHDKCVFNPWLAWTPCDKLCGGGQMRRSRTLKTWLTTSNMTKCLDSTTQETQGCNAQVCMSASKDCILAAWGAWQPCQPGCGSGMSERTREVTQHKQPGGIGCMGALEELKPCLNSPCVPIDCVWDTWSQWGACTTTCGGGTHQRIRHIKTKPRYGGKTCSEVPGDLNNDQYPWSQIAPCNTIGCNDVCVNGVWGVWGSWSACSASCDTGFRSRRRDLAEVPNACGKPAEGSENEIVTCQAENPCVAKRDCETTMWNEWAACSNSCFGMQGRQRLISTYAQGGGKPCYNESLKEIRPCNPLQGQHPSSSCSVLPHHDCTLTNWAPWQDCPVSCGGGQHTRARRVVQPPSGGGKSCTANLTMTRSCNTNKCGNHCVNCKWGQWAMWGACTKGGNQRYRTRRVEQLPDHCGAPCLNRIAHETAACPNTDAVDSYWCVWSEWSAPSKCSGTCGNVTNQRQRQLSITRTAPATYLYKSHKDYMCAGSQFEVNVCLGTPACAAEQCVPQNCVMNAWSQWSAPQATGLCQRNRNIKENNNPCGTPCAGKLIETQKCVPADMKPVDCLLSQWGQWSHCPSMLAQRYRVRGVRREAAHGGNANTCSGALRQTVSCNKANSPIDCGETDWTVWGACTRTCGGGWMYRTRQANHPVAQYGGAGCTGPLKMLSICNAQSCFGTDADCVLADWSGYGVCFQNQQSRFRGIKQTASGLTGTGCLGALEETIGCGNKSVDCKVSPWTPWDDCDLECGGGQQNRHRTIWKHAKNGGTPCPTWNKETQGCNLQKCTSGKNCVLPAWAGWSACDSTCGIGQKTRTRVVDKIRETGGIGCLGAMQETAACGSPPPPGVTCPIQNCTWGLWSHWSQCSKSCESGYKTRHRIVAKPAGPKGAVCPPGDMKEGAVCNTGPCDTSVVCIDGAWYDWSPWETCTATCGGGVQRRQRKVHKTANHCGKVLVGLSMEVIGCKNTTADICPDANQDCKFQEWNPWSSCFSTCNGDKHRERNISQYGKGTGLSCNGTLKEVAACNPGEGEARPTNCAVPDSEHTKVDCAFNAWAEWAPCSAACGGGVRETTRNYNGAQNGGVSCTGVLKKIENCNEQLCVGSNASVNCEWTDWGGWGHCDRCNGVQRRQRQIRKHALRGGTNCEPSGAEELSSTGCTAMDLASPLFRYCNVAKFCKFADWDEWSACRATCGNSTRSRKRLLKVAPMETCSSFTCASPWVALSDPTSVTCRLSDGCTQAQCCSLPTTTVFYTTTVTTTVADATTAPSTSVNANGSARLYSANAATDMAEVAAMRQARLQTQGQMHMQEIIMAFGAGGASVFLIFTVVRRLGSAQRPQEGGYEGVQMTERSDTMLESSALE